MPTSNHGRRAAAKVALGAAALAALAAGCSPSESPQTEAAVWMAAHPVPAQPGMVAAMILPGEMADVGFAGAAAKQACPPVPLTAAGSSGAAVTHLDAWHEPVAGGLPGCGAWTATAITVTGHVIRLACGSIPGRAGCPLFSDKNGYIPSAGDYIRVRPGGGRITSWTDVEVIEQFADSNLILQEPDTGGPVFVTTPAGRS